MRRIHLTISGKVQGVYFRLETKNQADTLGVKGWVENLANGSMEITAEDKDAAINKFLEYCHRGPDGAIVKDVAIKEEKYQNEFKNLEIKF